MRRVVGDEHGAAAADTTAASTSATRASYFTLVAKFEVVMDGFGAVKNCRYRMSPSKKTFIHDNPYRPTMPA
jgi:hypothetical protein